MHGEWQFILPKEPAPMLHSKDAADPHLSPVFIGRFIRDGRQRLGMSEEKFATAVGVTRSAVQQWERVGGTSPKRANQRRVAELLGVSVAELLGGGVRLAEPRVMCAEVPLLSSFEAADFNAIDNFLGVDKFEMVAITSPLGRRTFALRVSGDSMESGNNDSFHEGSIIVVDPELGAVPGDYVVVLQQPNEATFEQLVKDGEELLLKPLNRRYPIRLLGDDRIIGVVREVIRRFR
jgi:SOS-response transcriptional repressor LexA